jgi:outer membrane protein assembly factor BamD (BamD/ComL family)
MSKQETYSDLEHQHADEKHTILTIENIKTLIKNYPNDADLGKEIRKFINFEK